MAEDPFMTLPASALRHAAKRRDAVEAERHRFDQAMNLANKPHVVNTIARMWVTCERCGHPVERMGWTGSGPVQTFTVWCHGETETMDIALGADVVAMTGGVAFRRKVAE